MDVIHDRVAGLDVHKETIVACVRIMVGGKATRQCRTFDTTTAGLEALLSWLAESGCTQVAMEATGVYWKPVWNILSDGKFELIVANAKHIKNVPGRKTDMNDAMWFADLVSVGLIKASFVPEAEMQELRSLLRARKQLTREQTRHVQRIQKTLEEANIKLDSVNHRYHGPQRPADDRGDAQRHHKSLEIGRPCGPPDQGIPQGVVRCAAWQVDRSPSVHVAAPFAAIRCLG
jgi:transposase